jgi:hypothetical protein
MRKLFGLVFDDMFIDKQRYSFFLRNDNTVEEAIREVIKQSDDITDALHMLWEKLRDKTRKEPNGIYLIPLAFREFPPRTDVPSLFYDYRRKYDLTNGKLFSTLPDKETADRFIKEESYTRIEQ